jgi:hypothetical protein
VVRSSRGHLPEQHQEWFENIWSEKMIMLIIEETVDFQTVGQISCTTLIGIKA